MGSGIAQASAQAGLDTLLYEPNEQVLSTARSAMEKNMNMLVDKGKMTSEEKDRTLERLRFTSDNNECIADIFIEAIVEKPAAKAGLFRQLALINSPVTIFASNTSSLSITSLAEEMADPSRLAGMHFFNPATIMKLVEVVKTRYTTDEMINTLCNLAVKMGKVPVICKDSPGFIVNRVARPYYIESLRMAEEGQVDFAQADRLLESAGFKMGPFKLMDLIGNDVNYAVSCSVYEQLGKPERLKPSYIQEQHVVLQKLGRKSGVGYYKYNG